MSVITVIIPTLNEENVLGLLLDDLTGLEGTEIIVCDGGSIDQTAVVCSEYEVKYLQSLPGRARQQNTAALVAQGDILFFLHADSRIDSEVLHGIRECVEEGRKWGCCTMAFDTSGLFYKLLAWGSKLRVKMFSSCFGDQGIFCERELFVAVGGFPDITFMEDVALSVQLRKKMKAKIIPQKIFTSARRFETWGRWKVLLMMQWVKFLYKYGVDPAKLREIFKTISERQH